MTGTRTRGWPHPAGRPADDLAALLGGNPATAGPGALTGGTTVVFYGRTARPAGTSDSQADRHRQLALCRTVIAAHGGQVIAEYFDERCRGDCPWNRWPQGQALLAALSRPARPAGALVAADPSRLLPRRPPAGGTPILQQLALPPGPAHARRHRHLGPHSRGIPPCWANCCPARSAACRPAYSPPGHPPVTARPAAHGPTEGPAGLTTVSPDEHRTAGPRPGPSRTGQEIRVPRPGLDRGQPRSPRRPTTGRRSRSRALIEPADGIIVADYFDIGQSRSLPWKRRPRAAQLLADLADPEPGL